MDKRIGLSKAVAQALEDIRRQASCKHDSLALLRQRVYALAGGYEDLNDHQQLRHDLAIQSTVERAEVLPSSFHLMPLGESGESTNGLAYSSSNNRTVCGFLQTSA